MSGACLLFGSGSRSTARFTPPVVGGRGRDICWTDLSFFGGTKNIGIRTCKLEQSRLGKDRVFCCLLYLFIFLFFGFFGMYELSTSN